MDSKSFCGLEKVGTWQSPAEQIETSENGPLAMAGTRSEAMAPCHLPPHIQWAINTRSGLQS